MSLVCVGVSAVNYNITAGETFLGLEQAAEVEKNIKCLPLQKTS